MTIRRAIYIICFFFFCVIDQRVKTCSGLDGLLEIFRNLSGVVMAILILTFWSKEEFTRYRVQSLIWGILWLVGGVAAFFWGMYNRPFLNEWTVTIVNVGIYGWLLLHLFLSVWQRRSWRILLQKGKKRNIPLLLMLFMFVWMILSKSTYLWPFCYLVMFGSYYYWSGDRVRRCEMIRGMCDGVLVAFFAFWAYCLVFRPLDMLRYNGIYTNPNMNALFYLMCLAAVLTKWVDAVKKGSVLLYRIFLYVIMGCILSFLFMTIGRIAWVSAFVMVLVAIIFMAKIGARNVLSKRKQSMGIWKAVVKRGSLVLLTVILMAPICFTTVRLVPPFFHHVVWFWGEWSEDRVHSWDRWYSDKFTDPDEFLDAAFGRVAKTVKDLLAQSPLALTAYAAPGDSIDEPVMTDPETITNSYLIRGNIYRWYAKQLNLLGHQEVFGFQLQKGYWVGHTHNIFLQMGIDFGIPVLLIFAVLMVMSLRICGKKLLQDKGETIEYSMCFWVVAAIFIFGMLEYAWQSCSLSMMLLFLNWRIILEPRTEEREVL
jgi:hypothetical protein